MEHDKSSVTGLWRLVQEGGQPITVFGLACTSILRTARDLACLITLANATNSLIYGGPFKASLFWMAVAMFAGSPIFALDRYCFERYRLYLRCGLTKKLAEKLEQVDLAWLEKQPSGKLLSVTTADLEKFIQWASVSMPELIRIGTYTLVVIAYCFSQSSILTLCIVPVIIITVPLISIVSRPLEKMTGQQRAAAAVSLQKTQEALKDPEFIKAYGLEQTMQQRVEKALEKRRLAEENTAFLSGVIEALSYTASYLPGLIAAGVGALFLIHGELTAGFLVGFVQIAVKRLGELVPKIGQIVTSTRQAQASSRMLLEVLDAPVTEGGSVKRMEGERVVELKHVKFSYEAGHPVLRDISLHADKGELVAIVGESGCGKSTIFKLLMGVYQTYEGEILLGGSTLRKWNVEAMRRQIAPVFQSPFLFPFTIEENLWSRDTKAEEKVLWQVLEEASAVDFVRALPQGMQTRMDEQGMNLSGGQRQRMTLARAFLKDAPLILLDEPTSALDSVTESSFQQAFDRLRQGRTALVVAHRLSTIQNADRIYVLEHGTIAQCGTHEELIQIPGIYRTLYENQDRKKEVAG